MKGNKFLRNRFFWLVLWGILFSPAFVFADLADIETAIIEKDFAKARKSSEDFLSLVPPKEKANQARYYLGLSQLNLSEYEQARKTFEELMQGDLPKALADKAFVGVVDSFYMAENYEEALKRAEAFLSAQPNSEYSSLVYLKAARANLKLTQWEVATQYLKKIISHFPKSPEAHLAKQFLAEKRYFAVQVGSFLERPRAENLLAELKGKGEYAYIVETMDKDGRKFYRVRLGQFSALREAKQLREKLSHLGYPTLIYP